MIVPTIDLLLDFCEFIKLYNLCPCLLTFSYLSISICTFVFVGWLNFIIHALLCPVTRKLGAFVQFVLSVNQFEHIDHCVNNL